MKNIFLMLALILTFGMFSQEKISYKTKKEEVNFMKSSNLIYVESTEPLSRFSLEKIIDSGENFVIIQTTDDNYREKVESLKRIFKNVEPILIYTDGIKQVCFDEIIIKTKSNLEDILKGIKYTFKPNELEKNQYLVKLSDYDTRKTFNLINSLFNDERLEYIEPNFIKLNVLQATPNDPLLSSQWSIKNSGYLGGTIDADMDVDNAWAISTGLGIKVAVLDVGVDLLHPDLQANLLPGYDAINGVAGGGFIGASYHGTACAGIIGAVANNGIGIAGVAYNSKIIPIRVGSATSITINAAATGTNWAWQNGADILSNSWGGGSSSAAVNDAINNAVTNGRGGKGCIVLYSAGNSNTNVSWPATNAQVIAVSATSQCDQRKSPSSCDGETFWGTNYGINLDVSAPGVKIYTTDILGAAGYETGDYTPNFNGTSSACPNVAGVVALILSLKPSLTGLEARQILESNTDKVGGYNYVSGISGQPNGTWSNDLGYGRVNAFKALSSIAPIISGPNIICASPSTFTLINNLSSTSWTVSPNLQIISSTNNSVVVSEISNGQGTITANLPNGQAYSKSFWVGAPSFSFDYTYYDVTPSKSILCIVSDNPNFSLEQQAVSNVTFKKSNSTTFLPKLGLYCTRTTQPLCIEATVTNACGSTIFKYNCDLFRYAASNNFFTVFPNPAKDTVTIDLVDFANQPSNKQSISAELFDMMGYSKSKIVIKDNKANFSVNGLTKGVYIVKITNDELVESHQIVVE